MLERERERDGGGGVRTNGSYNDQPYTNTSRLGSHKLSKQAKVVDMGSQERNTMTKQGQQGKERLERKGENRASGRYTAIGPAAPAVTICIIVSCELQQNK